MFWRFIEIYADPDDSRIILLLWLLFVIYIMEGGLFELVINKAENIDVRGNTIIIF
jgi:hypothetical protein